LDHKAKHKPIRLSRVVESLPQRILTEFGAKALIFLGKYHVNAFSQAAFDAATLLLSNAPVYGEPHKPVRFDFSKPLFKPAKITPETEGKITGNHNIPFMRFNNKDHGVVISHFCVDTQQYAKTKHTYLSHRGPQVCTCEQPDEYDAQVEERLKECPTCSTNFHCLLITIGENAFLYNHEKFFEDGKAAGAPSRGVGSETHLGRQLPLYVTKILKEVAHEHPSPEGLSRALSGMGIHKFVSSAWLKIYQNAF